MNGILIRWLILTVSILVTSYMVDGIHANGFLSAVFASGLLGILNAFFRPILFLITLPINLLTLGLFTFVINAVLLMMVSGVIPGFYVAGFGSALFGSLLISIVSWLITSFISGKGQVQYIDLKRVGRDKWE